MLVATAGAATQGPPTFAAVGVHAGAHAAGASVSADAGVAAPVPAAPAVTVPTTTLPPPPAHSGGSGNQTQPSGSGNETPPPPPPPQPNATADHAPVLSPHAQDAYGRSGRAEFDIVVTNAAHQAQLVTLSTFGPYQWSVALQPSNVSLAPGETAYVHGVIDSNDAYAGSHGTVGIFARDSGGNDSAYVSACFPGVVQSCGAPPSNDSGNHTSSPPTNNTGNQTQPPTNDSGNSTQPDPLPPVYDPSWNHTSSNSTGNSTQQHPGNSTGHSGNSTGQSGNSTGHSDNSTYVPPSNETGPLPPQGNSTSAPTAPTLPTDEPTAPEGGDDPADAWANVTASSDDSSETVGI